MDWRHKESRCLLRSCEYIEDISSIQLVLLPMLNLENAKLELTPLLIAEIVLAGGDSPKSFPEGTDSVVIFKPSNVFSFEAKIF